LRGRNYSRRQQFDEVERNTLMPLPALRDELKKHQYATVAKNGHVGLSAEVFRKDLLVESKAVIPQA
jgi:hypothetical protein